MVLQSPSFTIFHRETIFLLELAFFFVPAGRPNMFLPKCSWCLISPFSLQRPTGSPPRTFPSVRTAGPFTGRLDLFPSTTVLRSFHQLDSTLSYRLSDFSFDFKLPPRLSPSSLSTHPEEHPGNIRLFVDPGSLCTLV